MAKAKGRTLLIKIRTATGTPDTMTVLCALTTKSIDINNATIDVTTADCTTPGGAMWQEVLDGVKTVSVTGEGFSKKDTAEAKLTTVAMASPPVEEFEIVVPNFGTFTGEFFVSTAGFRGDATGGLTFSLSLTSNGVITFTPEA